VTEYLDQPSEKYYLQIKLFAALRIVCNLMAVVGMLLL
jgi:hypothetical protein